MEKENLSKQKWIYSVYATKDALHVEKYPIIYANQEKVYFKKHGNDDLSKVDTELIKNTLDEIVKDLAWRVNNKYYYGSKRYSWTCEGKETYQADWKKKVDEANYSKLLEEVEICKEKLETAQESYKKALEKVEAINSKVNK